MNPSRCFPPEFLDVFSAEIVPDDREDESLRRGVLLFRFELLGRDDGSGGLSESVGNVDGPMSEMGRGDHDELVVTSPEDAGRRDRGELVHAGEDGRTIEVE